MSVIYSPQEPTNSLVAIKNGADAIKDGAEAVDEYAVAYSKAQSQLGYLQRASARMILDALDSSFPPSEARSMVRTRVLDTLAYYAKEVDRWASSIEPVEAETSKTPSST